MNKKTQTTILEYLDLDLNNIPEEINNNTNIDIKASEINNEKNYKVYKHIPIKDIEIVLTNTRRLDPASQKIEKMMYLSYYFNKKNEEEYNLFLNLLKDASINEIDEIEKIQKKFKSKEPSRVKYNKDYLWQIYYIERSNKYYMIVPLQETEQQCFWYLLKKKIENSKEKIYVPICNMECNGEILEKSKINKLENNLYFFTKEWPQVYEVYNNKDNVSLVIIGNVDIYENIKSEYKMVYYNKEDTLEFYDLIKVLFYLQTELSNYYKFDIFLDEEGRMHFYYNNNEIIKSSLKDFYSEEIKRNLKSIKDVEKIQNGLINKLNKIKTEEKQLNAELLNKQKQISTFLECKKSFFGRVKYYFKYSKKKHINTFVENSEEIEEVIDAGKIIPNYTNDIEDLIDICKDLRTKTTVAATTRLDIQNLSIKIEILKKKIENASKYIEEIESHKKSIFEFWKFTNKDEKNQLSEGITKIEEDNRIEKFFDIKEDFDELKKYLDLNQRKKLSIEEQNAIFLANMIGVENITKPEIDLNMILKEGSTFDNNTDNVLHREKPKNVQNILGLDNEFTKEEAAAKLKEIYKNIDNAFKKCNININLSVYSLQKPENRIMMFEINPKNLNVDNQDLKIYKINLKQNTSLLALSNIIFFNNRNDTLPVGMDYSTNVFVDLRKVQIIEVSNKINNIITLSEISSTYHTSKINIIEFNV